MNRFLYAEGNPWSMVDPSGHASTYEGGGCGPGGKYCGSTANDQNFHKNVKKVVAKAHNDYVHHVKARMYDPEATPTISSEWASGDTWGENTSIGRASAFGAAVGGLNRFGQGRNCTFRGCFANGASNGDAGTVVLAVGLAVVGGLVCIAGVCEAIAVAATAAAAADGVIAAGTAAAAGACQVLCDKLQTIGRGFIGAYGGSSPPEAPIPSIAAKAEAGVSASTAAAIGRGENILGHEITIDTIGGVRTRFDTLTQDVDGALWNIESKNGPGAALTPNQRIAIPDLSNEGGIPAGKNASAAGLVPGELTPPIQTRIDWWNLGD